MTRLYSVATVMILMGLLGCDMGAPGSPVPGLYERLGGEQVVVASMESFYTMLKEDPLMLRTFNGVFEDQTGGRATRFKSMMGGLICYMADGGCWYVGLSMPLAHAHMDITEEEFDAMMDHLDRALEVNKVGEKERREVVALFIGMKSDIVN